MSSIPSSPIAGDASFGSSGNFGRCYNAICLRGRGPAECMINKIRLLGKRVVYTP